MRKRIDAATDHLIELLSAAPEQEKAALLRQVVERIFHGVAGISVRFSPGEH